MMILSIFNNFLILTQPKSRAAKTMRRNFTGAIRDNAKD